MELKALSMLHCVVIQPLLSLCIAWMWALPLALLTLGKAAVSQTSSIMGICLCQGSLGDLFLSTQGGGGNRMRLYNLQLHGAFHPKGNKSVSRLQRDHSPTTERCPPLEGVILSMKFSSISQLLGPKGRREGIPVVSWPWVGNGLAGCTNWSDFWMLPGC